MTLGVTDLGCKNGCNFGTRRDAAMGEESRLGTTEERLDRLEQIVHAMGYLFLAIPSLSGAARRRSVSCTGF